MPPVDFSKVLKIFGGNQITAEEQEALYKEALLMTLARATSADTNIDPAEVQTVKDVIEGITGEAVELADIRVAAASAIYESAPLKDYLRKSGKSLSARQRRSIVNGLAEIIRSDSDVRSAEVEFFNSVCEALGVSPAELAGLIPDAP